MRSISNKLSGRISAKTSNATAERLTAAEFRALSRIGLATVKAALAIGDAYGRTKSPRVAAALAVCLRYNTQILDALDAIE